MRADEQMVVVLQDTALQYRDLLYIHCQGYPCKKGSEAWNTRLNQEKAICVCAAPNRDESVVYVSQVSSNEIARDAVQCDGRRPV